MKNRTLKTYTTQLYYRNRPMRTANIVAYHVAELKEIINQYNRYMTLTGKYASIIEKYDVILKPRMPIEWRVNMYNKQREILYDKDI